MAGNGWDMAVAGNWNGEMGLGHGKYTMETGMETGIGMGEEKKS